MYSYIAAGEDSSMSPAGEDGSVSPAGEREVVDVAGSTSSVVVAASVARILFLKIIIYQYFVSKYLTNHPHHLQNQVHHQSQDRKLHWGHHP